MQEMKTKFIFVTGGVVSSLGKGIVAASLGRLLKNRGYSVSINKLDPYINIDPGTMNPYQHGEVYVTDDGAETDLDIGHYERFIDESLGQMHNTTCGRIYEDVLNKERRGFYNGGTVQVIPHISGEIMSHILRVAEEGKPDILITEIGGTVGDIESQPFLEAVRRMKRTVGAENYLSIHTTLVPFLGAAGEAKSKPTQHSVKELLGFGIQPDIIVCRTDRDISEELLGKISSFCNVERDCVIQNQNVESLYMVPLMLEENGLGRAVCRKLNLSKTEPDMAEWQQMVDRLIHPVKECTIAIVGKYVELHDAYLSIVESLVHGGIANRAKVRLKWIQAADLTPANVKAYLGDVDGVLVPGGFGERGLEGKINAITYCRENKVPFFGICLGMQMAAVEFARNVLELPEAHSAEVNPHTANPIIDIMHDHEQEGKIGGTQRLGKYDCALSAGSIARKCYMAQEVSERHRHRYEFNNRYWKAFEENGMQITGVNTKRGLAEIMELQGHPWFVGVQFHPEFKSRPDRPHPLFAGFVGAALDYQEKRGEKMC